MLRSLLAVTALLAGIAGTAGPPAAAAASTCQVKNLTTRVNYGGALQSAIDAAANGDVIGIKGVCTGNFSIPGSGSVTDLTLAGQPGRHLRSALDGNGSGTVLTVEFDTSVSQVTIRNLRITGGSQRGIFAIGNVELDGHTSVSGNAGGGIFTAGTLVMNDRSSVSGNTAFAGGGIDDEGGVILNDHASVHGNTGQDGGGIFDDDTLLVLNDHSLVTGNTAAIGGGIYEIGHVTLSGHASVIRNTATVTAGGILAMQGVDVCPSWTGAISPNTPDDPPPVTPVTC